MSIFRHVWFIAVCAAGLGGCIIGTWPTPDDQPKERSIIAEGTPMAPEACDGVDNDADGAVDEGCLCSQDVRGCIGREGGQCGLGLQWCADGRWAECTDIGPPLSPAQIRSVEIVNVAPVEITRGGSEEIIVRTVPQTECAGISPAWIEVVLHASLPVMRVRQRALDDGVAPDLVAGDGEFAAALPNVFGPGVPEQTLVVQVVAALGGVDVAAVMDVTLVEP